MGAPLGLKLRQLADYFEDYQELLIGFNQRGLGELIAIVDELESDLSEAVSDAKANQAETDSEDEEEEEDDDSVEDDE